MQTRLHNNERRPRYGGMACGNECAASSEINEATIVTYSVCTKYLNPTPWSSDNRQLSRPMHHTWTSPVLPASAKKTQNPAHTLNLMRSVNGMGASRVVQRRMEGSRQLGK